MVMKINTINRFLGLATALLFIALIVSLIVKSNEEEERFNWRGGVVVEKDNPIQISKCTSYDPQYHHNKIIQNTWDNVISSTDISQYKALLPENFSIEWFSYNENKHYKVDVPLPTELVLKTAKKYRSKEQIENKKRGIELDFYHLNFVAEVKHGGVVSIWLTDGHRGGERIELCSGVANEVELEWAEFDPECKFNRNEWVDIVKKRYNWSIVLDISGLALIDPIKTLSVGTYVNIDYNFILDRNQDLITTKLNADTLKYIPESITVRWHNTQDQLYSLDLQFADREIIDAFAELYTSNDVFELTEIIVSVIGKDYNHLNQEISVTDVSRAAITLRRGRKVVKLNHVYGVDPIYHPNG